MSEHRDLAMRIETQGGWHTNYPGETRQVFDVTVAAVPINLLQLETFEADGRTGIKSSTGAIVIAQPTLTKHTGHPSIITSKILSMVCMPTTRCHQRMLPKS